MGVSCAACGVCRDADAGAVMSTLYEEADSVLYSHHGQAHGYEHERYKECAE